MIGIDVDGSITDLVAVEGRSGIAYHFKLAPTLAEPAEAIAGRRQDGYAQGRCAQCDGALKHPWHLINRQQCIRENKLAPHANFH